MRGRKLQPEKRWSIFPSFHEEVSRLLEEDDVHCEFHELDDSQNCTRSYDTNIMGRFICRNRACGSNGWSSKRIAITIRMYPGATYNARVYHQRCKICNRLSRPILNESYAERVAYRLKRWNGIRVEQPYHVGTSARPHNSDLCEGCRDGHCSALRLT